MEMAEVESRRKFNRLPWISAGITCLVAVVGLTVGTNTVYAAEAALASAKITRAIH